MQRYSTSYDLVSARAFRLTSMKILVYFVGKPRDEHANALAAEYIKRSNRFQACEMREVQPARFDPFTKRASAILVLLDPAGKALNSKAFTALVGKAQRDARDLIFVLGGSDGLPDAWKSQADLLLSLTPMTMPHELARAVLAEQIYRALTGLRGHPYPR